MKAKLILLLLGSPALGPHHPLLPIVVLMWWLLACPSFVGTLLQLHHPNEHLEFCHHLHHQLWHHLQDRCHLQDWLHLLDRRHLLDMRLLWDLCQPWDLHNLTMNLKIKMLIMKMMKTCVFYTETPSNGRITHQFIVELYRFDRKMCSKVALVIFTAITLNVELKCQQDINLDLISMFSSKSCQMCIYWILGL